MIVICLKKCGDGFKEKVIQKWTRSDFSHVGIIFSDGQEGSSWSECGVSFKDHKIKRCYKYFLIKNVDEKKVKKFFIDRLDAKYNNESIVLSHLLNLGLGAKKKYTCSEIVYLALLDAGVINTMINPQDITPGILHELLNHNK